MWRPARLPPELEVIGPPAHRGGCEPGGVEPRQAGQEPPELGLAPGADRGGGQQRRRSRRQRMEFAAEAGPVPSRLTNAETSPLPVTRDRQDELRECLPRDGPPRRLSAASFIARSASKQRWVVAVSAWPSHRAMTVMSTPD